MSSYSTLYIINMEYSAHVNMADWDYYMWLFGIVNQYAVSWPLCFMDMVNMTVP